MFDDRAAVILTGGSSQRMGRPKEWLEIDGETLLHRVVRTALGTCSRVIVVGRAGQSLPSMPAEVTRVDDLADWTDQGPLAGTLAGLRALAATGCDLAYLGSVDAASVTLEHIRFMLDRLATHPALLASVPTQSEAIDTRIIIHGTSGAVRVEAAHEACESLLRRGQRSLRSLYIALEAEWLTAKELPDPSVLLPCNTPQEFEQLQQRLGAIP